MRRDQILAYAFVALYLAATSVAVVQLALAPSLEAHDLTGPRDWMVAAAVFLMAAIMLADRPKLVN